MTDSSAVSPGPASPTGQDGDPLRAVADFGSFRPARRRRRLIIAGVAGAVVLVVLVCVGFGTLAAGVGRLVRNADLAQDGRAQVETACLALEQRLNRLMPPGAARGPRERAAAIRDENAAVRPFLSEVEAIRGWSGPGGRDAWADLWRELLDARTGYADALERQVANGEPAFFIAPRDDAGRPVLTRLERGVESCAGSARRLAVPDL